MAQTIQNIGGTNGLRWVYDDVAATLTLQIWNSGTSAWDTAWTLNAATSSEAITLAKILTASSGFAANAASSVAGGFTVTGGNTQLGSATGNTVKSFNNTLDDGSGNTSVAGSATVGTASANQAIVKGAAAGSPPQIAAVGSDTDIGVTVVPKGTGTVQLGTAASQPVKSFNNTLDDGAGNATLAGAATATVVKPSTAVASFAGTTAGTVYWTMPMQGVGYKRVEVYLSGYENDTTTAQTITFPTAFATGAVVSINTAAVPGVSTTLTTLSIVPDTTTAYTGLIVVEGF